MSVASKYVVMAERILAGELEAEVLADYGLGYVAPRTAACPHDLVEREMAVTADGQCSLCLAAEVARLTAAMEELVGAVTAWLERPGAGFTGYTPTPHEERIAAAVHAARAALSEAR